VSLFVVALTARLQLGEKKLYCGETQYCTSACRATYDVFEGTVNGSDRLFWNHQLGEGAIDVTAAVQGFFY
jgi:hypothetical protein